MSFTQKLHEIVAMNEQGDIVLNPRIRAVIKARGLPIQVGYDLSKIGKKFELELKEYYEHRFELIKEHGEEKVELVEGQDPKQTGAWTVSKEKLEAFNKAHAELLNVDVTIEVNPIKLKSMGDKVEGITPDDLISCHAFIIE